MKLNFGLYYDAWMDNGLENLARLVDKNPSVKTDISEDSLDLDIQDMNSFLIDLKDTINHKMDSVIFVKKQDKAGLKKNVRKDFVLVQYGKKVGERNVLKEKIYSDTNSRLNEIFREDGKEGKTCILCNRKYSRDVDKLKQSVYPFVTKIRSLSGVRTLKDNYDNLCPFCYLVGSLEWLDEGIIYRCFVSGGKSYSIALMPYMKNLKALTDFKKNYVTAVLNSNDAISNLKVGNRAPVAEFSTTLYFYQEFFDKVWFKQNETMNSFQSSEKEEICKDWVIMRIPSGNVKNIKLDKLSVPQPILQVIYDLTKKGLLIYSVFISRIFINFKREMGREAKDKINQNLKEKVAESIIKDDFNGFASALILGGGNHVVFPKDVKEILDNLLILWRWNRMGLKEDEMKTLKSVSRIVGSVSQNHVNILYKLDKARNPGEFLDGLRELSKRIVNLDDAQRKLIYPPALSDFVDLVEQNRENRQVFEDLRNILVIYSCVELSVLNYKEGR